VSLTNSSTEALPERAPDPAFDAASAPPMLCVSIHDVAPATWADCLRLVQAIRAVADIPLTWLVVPHYHFRPEQSTQMEAGLDAAVARGDELALHGYSHLDTEANSGNLRSRFLRSVYTRREGEFAALSEAEARRRLELGLAWFAERGWTPSGFVPPAWLLGEGAWRALRTAPFTYTTTFSHFHCLPAAHTAVHTAVQPAAGADGAVIAHPGKAILSPSLVYAARNRSGRLLSPRVADATAALLARSPLVRFSLHPPDARYPELVRHIQRILERLLTRREAVTKAECARRLTRADALPALPALPALTGLTNTGPIR
jgi:predicted deacetylase